MVGPGTFPGREAKLLIQRIVFCLWMVARGCKGIEPGSSFAAFYISQDGSLIGRHVNSVEAKN